MKVICEEQIILEEYNSMPEEVLRWLDSQIDDNGQPLIAKKCNIVITPEEANRIVASEVQKILEQYDYVDIGDVYAFKESKSPYQDEAQKIADWYIRVWDWYYDYVDGKQEIEYEEFLQEMPRLEETEESEAN